MIGGASTDDFMYKWRDVAIKTFHEKKMYDSEAKSFNLVAKSGCSNCIMGYGMVSVVYVY